MFISSKLTRVILFSGKIDFRKRFDGLLAICYQYGYDPYEGDCMAFVSRNRREVRVFWGDELGLYLVCRRFDGGTIKFLLHKDELTQVELACLLQGAQILVQHQVSSWKKNF